ncbi:MAG TPA: OmpA family protein [Anaeromyxobacteraceae bacterium]|nr:OmpA family protein [Anaeromyxobacteraceae bacterium]
MRRLFTILLVAAAACVVRRGEVPPVPAKPGAGEVLRAAELARVRCLLVAPFENTSNSPSAADAATGALMSGVDPSRTRVFPVPELRALFRDTAVELPQGIAPSLALELAELLGADAVLYGSVDGRSQGTSSQMLVTLRLTLAGDRGLIFARTAVVRSAPGERSDTAVRRAVLSAARPMLALLGDGVRKRCFDPERLRKLHKIAEDNTPAAPVPGAAGPERPAPAVAAAAPAQAAGPSEAARAAPAPTTTSTVTFTPQPAPGKADEPAGPPKDAPPVKRFQGGERFVVEDVAFAGRTSRLQRDQGLKNLATALRSQPAVKVRLEGFVDATSNRSADAKLSVAMARSAAARLSALGVGRQRVAFAGRGGESPILPNFTVRGRAANRRIEVLVLR